MSFLDQLKMTRALEEKGREEVAAKKKAEAYISKTKDTLEASKSMGVEAGYSLELLQEAEQEMVEKDYHRALELSHRALEIIEGEAQTHILDRYIQLRRIFTVGMVPPSSDLDSLLLEGEQALSTSIPHSVDVATRAYQAIHAYLISSKAVLREKLLELFPDQLDDERISIPLDNMMSAEGDAETIHAAMERVLDAAKELLEDRIGNLKIYQQKLTRFNGEMEFMDIIWKDVRDHFKEDDFETVNKELDLIEKDLDEQRDRGFPVAVENAFLRLDALDDSGSSFPKGRKRLEAAKEKFDEDPMQALDEYISVMDDVREKESGLISDMIQEIRDMITVGRHVNIDMEDVIIGLDNVRQRLNMGELKVAIAGVEDVKVVLLEKMSGYNELEMALLSLSELIKEVDEYDLDLDEAMEIVDEAREVMTEGEFDRSLSLVKDAMKIIHARTKDMLGAKLILAQKSLHSGFRMDADILEDSDRLGELFQRIQEGGYKGTLDDIVACHHKIDSKLRVHAKSYLDGFLALVDERQGLYDVKKMRLQAKGAEKLLKEGSSDESYRIIWTARRQLANLDLDLLESKLKKVRELVATGEAVDVEVSDLKRRMFSFTYDSRKVDLETIREAEELGKEVRERLYNKLLNNLHTDHILTYQAKMVGYHTDDQLNNLKKAFRLLESGEFRATYGALREADIGYNIQILVHDEVYERLLRIADIIEKEDLDPKGLENTIRLFQRGEYREADIESKKTLRSLIERGLKTAASGILEDSRKLIEIGDILDLKILSLRESLPQAAFFLENEDYRHASSLMEKAIRTARAEISKSLQDRILAVRPRISEPAMEARDKNAALDMLENARQNMEAGHYDTAVEILSHLEMDLDQRDMLLNRARMAQMRARDFMGLGKMLGVSIEDQERLWEDGRVLLREGKSMLAYEIWERTVDQVGDLIAMGVRGMQEEAVDKASEEGLSGPDLDLMMQSVDAIVTEVRERRFHAAKDASTQIASCLEELRLYRDELECALEVLESLISEMTAEGISAKPVTKKVKDAESLKKNGEFQNGLELCERLWLEFNTMLNAFRDGMARAADLKASLDATPETWDLERSEKILGMALTSLSEGTIEEGLRSLMTLEREMHNELQGHREKAITSAVAVQKEFCADCRSDMRPLADQDLERLHLEATAEMKKDVEKRLKKLRSALETSKKGNVTCRRLADSSAEALLSNDVLKAYELLAQACMALDRDNDGGLKAISDRSRIRKHLEELRGYGVDTRDWEKNVRSPPIGRMEVDQMLRRCVMRIEEERKSLMPKITVDRVEDHLVIRNHGPGVARDVKMGDHTIAYLGIGRSRALPPIEEGTMVDIVYYPLTFDTPRVLKIKV